MPIRDGLGAISSLATKSALVSSDEAVDEGKLDGAFLRGPLARPLVICVSCGPESGASVFDVEVLMLTAG